MIRSLLFVTLLTVLWVLSEHPVALVFLAISVVWFLNEWLSGDEEPLAPYRMPYKDGEL